MQFIHRRTNFRKSFSNMNIQKQLKPTTENFRKLMENVHIFTFWEDFSINKIEKETFISKDQWTK